MTLPNDTLDFLEIRTKSEQLLGAYAPESLRVLTSHARAFLTWLAARDRGLPARADELAAYLKDRTDLSPTHLRKHMHAISLMHRNLDHADPADSRPVQLALMAARRTRGHPRRQATALDPATIRAIARAAEPDLVS